MAIVNRTLDATEQRKAFQFSVSSAGNSGPLITGATSIVGIVPWPCTFIDAQIAAFGTSGSPTYALALNRFIAGTGFTTWLLATGTSNTPAAFGTSGPGSFGTSLFGSLGMVTVGSSTQGSTLQSLQANDVLTVTTGGANSAALALAIGYVLQPTVDIKTNYGLGF